MPESDRLIVVGGGPAGMSAAVTARRRQPRLEIVVFEQGSFVSSILCVLPYYISGLIADVAKLAVYTPEYFRRERGIQVLTKHRVEAVNRERRTVVVRDLSNGQRRDWRFRTLVLATGARARLPDMEGLDLDGVFSLRSIENAIAIRDYLQRQRPRRAAILGGGYVGLEMAEAFRALGLEVRLFEATPAILPGFDRELSSLVEQELRQNGVTVHLEESALRIAGDGRRQVRRMATAKGEYEADLVLLATGITPSADLAASAGAALGASGAIHVDAGMRTTAPDVLAAGDVAEAWHRLLHAPAYMPLGTTANKQGRVAGNNAGGAREAFAGIVGTMAVKVFGLELARTGLSDREAQAAGYWALSPFEPASITATGSSRAGMFPGATPLWVKLVVEAHSRKLLGAQMVGRESVAKRIDTIAVALHAGLTLDALPELDLTYAPPLAPSEEAISTAARRLGFEL